MKARVIPGVYKKAVDNYLKNNEQDMAREITRKVMKMVCYSLNYHYDFGNKRCMRVLTMVNELANDLKYDEDGIFWDKVDMLMDKLKLPFEKSDITYD